MANHKSAIKRHRQSLKRYARNRSIRTRIKNTLNAVRAAVQEKDFSKAQTALNEASSVLDKASTKSVIHWRSAARRISRLQRQVNEIA